MDTTSSNEFRERPGQDGDGPESTEEWIERLLTEYPALGEEDRTILAARVAEHPRYEDCLKEASRLDRMLRDARRLNDPGEDVKSLPWVLLESRGLEQSERKRSSFEADYLEGLRRVLVRANRSDTLTAEKDRIEEKIHSAVTGESLDSHFERVTGHTASSVLRRFRVGKGFFDQEAVQTVVDHRLTQRALRVGVTGIMMFVTLFSVSLVRDHGFTRLAQFRNSDYAWTRVGISNRGENPRWKQELRERYQSAVRMAEYSQKTVLGLFPAYDFRRLSLARTMLEKTIAMQREFETAPSNAHLLLAKIYFRLGQTDDCRTELERALTARNSKPSRAMTYLNVFEKEFGQ